MQKTLIVSLLTSALVALWWAWPSARDAAAPAPIQYSETQGDDALTPATASEQQHAAGTTPDQATEAELIRELRARFSPHIERPHAQIKLIEQLISYLQQAYPDDWRSRIAGLLDELFPEHAALLLQRFEGLLNYNDWLRDHRDHLRALPADQRQAQLWAQRHATFGESADQIWAAERRNQQIQTSLKQLNQAEGLDARQRLRGYLDSIEQAYGEHSSGLLKQRRTELMDRFLALDSVQKELREAPAPQRRETLRALRADLGMEEAALERWDALDARRDQQWAIGLDYMQQRETLVANGASEFQLAQLREQMLGEQASVVAAEEAAGFFRWQGERRIGRE